MFNKALLAKQAWRLVNNPNDLWARVLKGRYFHNCEVWRARKQKGASWAWQSIWDGLQTLKDGTRWNVANGRDVLIYEDKWIPSLPGYRVARPRDTEWHEGMVSQLINSSRREWDVKELERRFPKNEVQEIMKIPLGSEKGRDRVVWNFTHNGVYSVKSGYKRLMDLEEEKGDSTASGSQSRDEIFWRSVWRLKVEPRVKNFIWRCCRNVLATKENLAKRHNSRTLMCPRCEEHPESIEHLLWFCPSSEAIWRASNFNYIPDRIGFPGFQEWWSKSSKEVCIFGDLNMSDLLAYLLWNIWKARNSFCFEHVPINPIDVWLKTLRDFSRMVLDSDNILPEGLPTARDRQAQWVKPPRGTIKLNSDASWSNDKKSAALAVVARDHNGLIVGGTTKLVHASSAEVAEALAVRLAVHLALRQGWRNICCEMDCKPIHCAIIGSPQQICWRYVSVIEDITLSIPDFDVICFNWIPRCCNAVADWVAKACCKGVCPQNW